MSKEAEEFFRQKTIENAKRPRMKKFLALVNREAEGKILQEYADKQLRLYDVTRSTLEQKEEQTLTCDIKQENNKIVIDFSSDCGKFGTDEMLDGYVLTPERLLQILQDRDDYTDDEL